MKKKLNLKKVIFVIFIVIVILLALLTLLRTINSRNARNVTYEFRYVQEPTEKVEKLSDDVIVANNTYKFFSNYYNKIDAKDIQENWDNFTRIVVPKYTKNMTSSKDAKKYYNSNEIEVLQNTGIDNEEDFVLLVEKITSEYTQKVNDLKSIDILEDSKYNKTKEITTCKMKAIYDDNIEITFNFRVYNQKDDNNVFIVYE